MESVYLRMSQTKVFFKFSLGNMMDVRVRLAGSSLSSVQGRVEVYYSGVWGTVCDQGWDIRDAHVVCRMLGSSGAVQAKTEAFFGRGTGPIVLTNANCRGREISLANCTQRNLKSYCGHSRDAGVVCSTGKFVNFISRLYNMVSCLVKLINQSR